ncbi:Neutral/alkaline nonlysosomal ceramidase [Dichotomocladium elegans]|nr:Neutral/alkaline nonlysosomal ceramidase [Dichotomocladium elegans]
MVNHRLWGLITFLILSPFPSFASRYELGVAKADITGPVAEIMFMGYAEWHQVGSGLLQRIYARAYIVNDLESHKRIVFVNTDTQSMGDIVKKRVVERLQSLYGPYMYTFDNVMLSSTHTHSSMGGYLQYVLFQISVKGWIEETTQPMVDGIVRAIVKAHESLVPESILTLNKGELLDANINRSPSAYLLNPPEERAKYKHDVDKDMTLLGFLVGNGHKKTPLGFINWFPVHGTSVNSTNQLVNGDNKGYAAYVAEHVYQNKIVAGFAQANEGDVSPNTMGAFCTGTEIPCDGSLGTKCPGSAKCLARGPGWKISDYESNRIIGQRQADKALQLFSEAYDVLDGPVDFRQKYWDITKERIKKRDGTWGYPCPSALGYGFAAGTTDNPAIKGIYQNTTRGSFFWDQLRNLIKKPSKYQEECQAPKAVILNTGEMEFPYAWQPNILDIQLFRIGNFYIAAVPAEFTTMSGRRLRNAIKRKLIEYNLGSNDTTVVLSGPANGYASYVTTFEEYQMQRFEGGGTVYGPYTLDAYIQAFEGLAVAMATEKPILNSEQLPDYTPKAFSFSRSSWADLPPIGRQFGDVIHDVRVIKNHDPPIQTLYGICRTTVAATFVAGNPRHDVMAEKTFLTIERRRDNGSWEVVRNDNDYDTRFKWRYSSRIIPSSEATVEWDIGRDNPAGVYRIGYFGHHKEMISR